MQLSDSGKVICSAACISSITRSENIMSQLSKKAKGTSMASAYGSYLSGLIFISFAFVFNLGGALSAFLGATGLGMLFMGIFFHKNAANNSSASAS